MSLVCCTLSKYAVSCNSNQWSTQWDEHNIFHYSQLMSLPHSSYNLSPASWSEFYSGFGTFGFVLQLGYPHWTVGFKGRRNYSLVAPPFQLGAKDNFVATGYNAFSIHLWHRRGHQQKYFSYMFKAHCFKKNSKVLNPKLVIYTEVIWFYVSAAEVLISKVN